MKNFHPTAEFLFFLFVLPETMLSFNPVFLGISMVGALIYLADLTGVKKAMISFLMLLPVFMITAVINPLFNHRGVTRLMYIFDGNPLTLESVINGACSGVMLVSVLLWFMCFNKTITGDKIVYVVGRVLPRASLLVAMSLGFAPRLVNSFKDIRSVQRGMGKKGIGLLISTVMILFTVSFENSLVTSDSMRARGYDSGKRTSYGIYTLMKRDIAFIVLNISFSILTLLGIVLKYTTIDFYPNIGIDFGSMAILFYLIFAVQCVLPHVMRKF